MASKDALTSRSPSPGPVAGQLSAEPLGPAEKVESHLARGDHQKPVKRWARVGVETTAMLGIVATWYVGRRDFNRADWDWPGLDRKLTTMCFDNNSFLFNNWWHPLDGTVSYAFPRANGLSVLESLAVAVTASFLFEMFVEFPERISLNDMVMTPGGGMVLGEFWHQTGAYLNSGEIGTSWARDTAATTIGAPHRLHRWLDETYSPAPEEPDELGLSRAYWHRFEFRTGGGNAEASGSKEGVTPVFSFAFEGEVVAVPGYRLARHFDRWLIDGNVTQLRFASAIGETSTHAIGLSARVGTVSYYTQDLDGVGARIDSGHSLLVGLATAFEVSEVGPRGARDQRSLFHIVGPQLQLDLFAYRAQLAIDLAVFGDFAAISSVAWPDYRGIWSDEHVKSVLIEQGYWFGGGGTAMAEAELSFAGIGLGSRVSYGGWTSFEGHDRLEKEASADVEGNDSVFEFDAWLRYRLLVGMSPTLALSYYQREQTSRLGALERSRQHRMLLGSIGFQL